MIQQQVANPLFTFIQELHQHSHSVISNKGFIFKLEQQENYCGFEISNSEEPICEIFLEQNYICDSRVIGVGQVNELNNRTLFYYVESYKPRKIDSKNKDDIINLIVNFDENAGVISFDGHHYPSKRPIELTNQIKNKLKQNYAPYLSFVLYMLQLKNMKVEKILTEILALEINLFAMIRQINSVETCDECLQQANNINLLYKAVEKYTGYAFNKYVRISDLNDKLSMLSRAMRGSSDSMSSVDDVILDIERNVSRVKNISVKSSVDFVNRLKLINNTSELIMRCIINGSYQTEQLSNYIKVLNDLEKEACSQDSLYNFLLERFQSCDLEVIKKINEDSVMEMITPATMRRILIELIKNPGLDFYKLSGILNYLKEVSLVYKLTIFSLNYSFVPEIKINHANKGVFGDQGIIAQSFLHYAVSVNNLPCFELLLLHGANPNIFGLLVSDDDQEEQFSSIYLINLTIGDKDLDLKFLDLLLNYNVVPDVNLLNDYNLSLIDHKLTKDKEGDEEVKNIMLGDHHLRQLKNTKYALYTYISFNDVANVERMQQLIECSSIESLLVCLGRIINSQQVQAEEIVNNVEYGFSLFDNDSAATTTKISEAMASFDMTNNKLMLAKIVNCLKEVYFVMAQKIFEAINARIEYESSELKSLLLVKSYNSIYTQMNDVKHAETYLDYSEACIFILSFFRPLGYTYLFALFNLHLSAGEKILISKRESKMPPYMINKAISSYNKALEFYKILLKLFRANMDDAGVDQKELHLRLDRFRMRINPFFNSAGQKDLF